MIWRHLLLQSKFYEEDDLTSYTSGIFFYVTQGGQKACKYEVDWYVYYTVYSISVDTFSERNKTEDRQLVYLRDILRISGALYITERKGKNVFFSCISQREGKDW
jgi:hypothetical protein